MTRLIGLFLLLSTLPVQAQDASSVMQEALRLERSMGDYNGAIVLYRQLADDPGAPRGVAATALVQLGKAYESLGRGEAMVAYRRVVRDFTDQATAVAEARERMAGLTQPPPSEPESPAFLRHVIDIEDTMGNVSPDGRYLSYVDWSTGDYAILDLRTGESTVVETGRWEGDKNAYGDTSIWSRDGSTLLYVWVDESQAEGTSTQFVYLFEVESGRKRLLNAPSAYEVAYPASWLPNAQSYIATAANEIHLVNTETGGIDRTYEVPTISRALEAFASPDGKRIVTCGRSGDSESDPFSIVVLNLDSGNSEVVSDGLEVRPNARFSADGRHVLYRSDENGSHQLLALPVSGTKTAGSPRVAMDNLEPGTILLDVGRDGTPFLAIRRSESNMVLQGFDAAAGRLLDNARRVTPVLENRQKSGALSPSGERLAVVAGGPENYRFRGSGIAIVDLAAGETALPLSSPGLFNYRSQGPLDWSPDGRHVAFSRVWRGPVRSFVLLDTETGEERTFLEGSLVDAAEFSRDGSHLILSATDDGWSSSLLSLRLADGSVDTLFTSPVPIYGLDVNPADGRIAVLTIEEVGTFDPATGRYTPTPSQPAPEWLRHFGGVHWLADGQHVLVARDVEEGSVQFVVLDPISGDYKPLGPVWAVDDFPRAISILPGENTLLFQSVSVEQGLYAVERIELE